MSGMQGLHWSCVGGTRCRLKRCAVPEKSLMMYPPLQKKLGKTEDEERRGRVSLQSTSYNCSFSLGVAGTRPADYAFLAQMKRRIFSSEKPMWLRYDARHLSYRDTCQSRREGSWQGALGAHCCRAPAIPLPQRFENAPRVPYPELARANCFTIGPPARRFVRSRLRHMLPSLLIGEPVSPKIQSL